MARYLWPALLLTATMSVAHAYTLIETHQLFGILQTPGAKLHLLEVSGINEAEHAMMQHIPTARIISLKDLSDLSSWPLVKSPRQEDFIVRMKMYGIQLDNTPVVLYDRSGLLFAAKAWWVFTVFGRDFVTVLNGGLPKWQREGYSVSNGPRPPLLDPLAQNSALYNYQLDPSRMCSANNLTSIAGALTSPAQPAPVQLLDVRSKVEFDASSLKGSINMPIDIVRRADGTLRSAIELRTIFQMYAVRMRNDTLTVVMGLNGVDSSMALLSLAVVGNDNSAMVDGGWMEYSQWLRDRPAPAPVPTTAYTSAEPRDADSTSPVWLLGLFAGVSFSLLYALLRGQKKVLEQPFQAEKWL